MSQATRVWSINELILNPEYLHDMYALHVVPVSSLV